MQALASQQPLAYVFLNGNVSRIEIANFDHFFTGLAIVVNGLVRIGRLAKKWQIAKEAIKFSWKVLGIRIISLRWGVFNV